MLKSIKKTYNIFIGTVAVLILLSLLIFLIVRIPSVQTYVVKTLASYISKDIKSTISVGSVNFTLFNKIELKELLIKDQQNDTLIYAPYITAGIRQINRKTQTFKLGKVVIMRPVVGLITDSTGLMNLNWYLDLIQKPKDSASVNNSYFHINQIEISDGRFSLINKFAAPSKTLLNFNNIRLTRLNAIVENLDVRNDSTTLGIYNLGFYESNGFVVKKLSTNLLVQKQTIIFRDLSLLADSSIINADHVGIHADSADSFKKFTEEVKLDISLEKSLINSNDLKYFVTFLKDFNETFMLSGEVTGTVSELKGRNLHLTYKNDTYLDCNFNFSGLPDINNTFIFFDVNDFRSISRDIEQIKIPGKGNILLPEVLRKLGVVSFSGSFTGFANDFVTYGKINTNKGIISTDISLRPNGARSYKVKGLIKGSGIDLGSITNNPGMFGGLSMEANIDGTASSFEKFAGNLTGKVDSLEINNYKYRNIALKGLFTDKAWDGNIKLEDENIQLELLGTFNFNKKLPEFDFTMNLLNSNLYKLNIDKSDPSSSLKMLLTANLRGNNIDNLDGEVKLLNSNLRRNGNNLDIYDFTVKTITSSDLTAISIRTDFIDANLHGKYNFSVIRDIIKKKLAVLMPSYFVKPKSDYKTGENSFDFDIKFKNTDELNRFFKTGITLSENSFIQGSFFTDSIISISGNASQFSVNNNTFNNLSFNGSSVDTIAKLNISSSSSNISGLAELKNLQFSFNSMPDNFRLAVEWDNKEKIINKGAFIADGQFDKTISSQKNSKLRIGFQPAEVFVRNNLWKINPSTIIIDSSSVEVKKFSVSNNENYFLVDGGISLNTADTIHLEFNGITLDPLNRLYEKRLIDDPNTLKINIGGTLNGKISITDLYRNFMFESDIKVKDFTILGGHYGEIKIGSVWDNSRKVADLTAFNNFEGKRMFDIAGIFDPGIAQADLTAVANKLPIDLLNPLLKMFASGITGTASGKLRFVGDFNKPELTGALFGENASMKIDYLQTRYTFNDSIRLDKTGIKFNNIQSLDDKGNSAYFDGTVFHKYFKDFAVDLTIRTNDCMVLNTRPKDNDMFYGTAFASGVTTIKSKGSGLSFNISGRTGNNTRFFIPLKTGSSVTDKSYINFVDTRKDNKITRSTTLTSITSSAKSALDINIDLEVTPDAEVQIIFDSKAGDVMKGTGTGNLNISYNPKGEFKIYGDYIIEDGDYLFTLKSIFNKRFIVQSGGKISFVGDMSAAEIDIKAIYRLKTSLSSIMPPGILPDAKMNEKIPVECLLNLTGNLFNPVVGLEINLPTADEQTKAYLKSMINTDEEMSRQFAFLLVMNSFYADPTSGTNQSTADISSATVGVTTTEMLSNQISNWLSQINNNFDVVVGWRPGTPAVPNSQEVQLALSTQLLNDKVMINGNFDYGANQSSLRTTPGNNAITGAFDVEVKITEKIRFKVFNRSNDNFYIDNGVQYTQGVGLFYKQDFNKFKDLFRKSEKSPVKKEEENKVKDK
jgi:hypothetical protein